MFENKEFNKMRKELYVFVKCLTAYCVGSAQVSFIIHTVLIFILEISTQEQKTEVYRDTCVSRQDNEGNGVGTAS